jgi:hypothetical protein
MFYLSLNEQNVVHLVGSAQFVSDIMCKRLEKLYALFVNIKHRRTQFR